MIDQLKQNILFYALSVLFILVGLIMLQQLNFGYVVLQFGYNRSPFIDTFFSIITRFGEEITYAIICVSMLFVRFRYALLVPFIGILVTFLSYLLKTYFKHPRPAVFFRDSPAMDSITFVADIPLLKGLTGFPSGHTISAFCIFGFAAYVLYNHRHKYLLQLACFCMAALVGISRMYLFQHFLKDVVFGATLGILLVILCIALVEWPAKNANTWLDRSFSFSKAKPKA